MKYKIFLTKKLATRVAKGHNWIFDHEIFEIEGAPPKGATVHVYTHTGSFLGLGIYHPHTKIAIRLFSREESETDFLKVVEKCIRQAYKMRVQLGLSLQENLRLFNGEGDGLSGLYIDKYQQKVIVQLYTCGLEQYQDALYKIIKDNIPDVADIYFDKSHSIRQYEQLAVESFLDPIMIEYDGVQISYYDRHDFQMDRRDLYADVKNCSQGLKVWDLCSGTGLFSINAYRGGAERIVSIDNNERYIKSLNKYAAALSSDNMRWQIKLVNVFDIVRQLHKTSFHPEMIIFDPPLFNTDVNSLKPYREIIQACLYQISDNGLFLVGFQSSKIIPEKFYEMIEDCALKAKAQILIIKRYSNAMDMPLSKVYEHNDSLHFWMLKVVK